MIQNNLDNEQSHWIIGSLQILHILCSNVLSEFPHSYSALRAAGRVSSFQELLVNWFKPLFDVTLDPTVDPDLDKVRSSSHISEIPHPS